MSVFASCAKEHPFSSTSFDLTRPKWGWCCYRNTSVEVCCGSSWVCPEMGEVGTHLPDRKANFPGQELSQILLDIVMVCPPIPITGHTGSVVEKAFLLYSNIEYSHLFKGTEVLGICMCLWWCRVTGLQTKMPLTRVLNSTSQYPGFSPSWEWLVPSCRRAAVPYICPLYQAHEKGGLLLGL